MTSLICVGACYLDTILSVPHFPEEDAKLRATKLQVRRGGNCANSLEILQQLLARHHGHANVKPYLISTLPAAQTPGTQRIQDSFGPNPMVDFTRCIYRDGLNDPASSYILRSEASGSRTLVNYNELPEMTADEFSAAIDGVAGDVWVHFEGRIPETTLRCIQHLRHRMPSARVSVEVEKPGREGLEELAAEADVVFYSKTWAEHKGYQSARECLVAQAGVARRASLLLCTWGSEGASSLSRPNNSCVSCPALRAGQSVKVVDTVGAGDTFVAGMLFGLLCHPDDWDVEKKVRFAVQVATCKVQHEGFEGVGSHVMGNAGLA